MAWFQNAWYWMHDAKDGWLPVQFDEQHGDTVTLKTAEGEHYDLPASTVLRPALASSLRPCANLLELEELHEGAILNNLRLRYTKDDIYTAISSIIISINPYKQLPCYGPGQIALYRRVLAQQNSQVSVGGAPVAELPPHVYQLADAAYTSLLRDEANQAILISGESGAGKTEATKLVLQYLAEIGGQDATIAQQILEANPILEAFGNSKTVRNNNSSRFGKWMEIHFEDASGITARICGAQIFSYLLEKSRVVNQSGGERNYHSFYQLCAGASAEERKMLHIPANGAAGFRILTAGACLTVEGQDDIADYADLRNAMSVLNFDASESHTILKVLAAILHVGNIEFERDATTAGASSSTEKEKFRVSNAAKSLNLACELLSLDPEVCARSLLTRQLRIGGAEAITVFNHLTACNDNRDTLAKALYESLFIYLISKINVTLGLASPARPKIIGVLDIFGFEDFETGNHFEQLLINYSNEKLNNHFVDHIFRLESKTYVSEGLDVSSLAFVDHALCLALIEEKRNGILDMISEELRLPKGSDENLLQRMHDAYAPASQGGAASAASPTKVSPLSAYYIKPKTRDPVFGIRHYAGDVTYRIEEFIVKSKDTLPEALASCIESSKEPLIARLLDKHALAGQQQKSGTFDLGSPTAVSSPSSSLLSPPSSSGLLSPPPSSSPLASPRTPGAAGGSPLPPSSPIGVRMFGSISQGPGVTLQKLASPSAGSGGGSAHAMTLGAQFRSQLSDLLSTLNSCRANFLRCLKPNANKIADNFDSVFVLRQLQYLGIKEVISIRQQGFPVRMKYPEFARRYAMVLTNKDEISAARAAAKAAAAKAASSTDETASAASKSVATSILNLVLADSKDWRLGRTQVFFRSSVQQRLESVRDARFLAAVVKIQAAERGRQQRGRWKKTKQAARELEKAVREASNTKATPADAAALLAALDAALFVASASSLPPRLLTSARSLRDRLHLTSSTRRALSQAISSKDITALRKALEKAKEIGLREEETEEVGIARELMERLIAYHSSRTSALASPSISLLSSVLSESLSLGLDTPAEHEIRALLEKMQLEAEIDAELEKRIGERGPLEKLQEVIARAEAAGMVPKKMQRNPLFMAHALATLLSRELSLLASLSAAIAARSLAPLESCLHELLSDASLSSIYTHELVKQAQTLKAALLSAALASERAANLRASFAGRNAGYIEATLGQLRALGPEALASLGPEGEVLQKEAESLLTSLRSRGAALLALQRALEDRSEMALESALALSKEKNATDAPEHSQAERVLQSLRNAAVALDKACLSSDLTQIDQAIAEALKLGFAGPRVQPAQERRKQIVGEREIEEAVKVAVEANDETLLLDCLSRASSFGLSLTDPRLSSAQRALEQFRVARALEQAERDRAAQALKEEQARLAKEAEEDAMAQAAAQAAIEAARVQADAEAASSASSSSLSTATSHIGVAAGGDFSTLRPAASAAGLRGFNADLYRARHFQLGLFPLLRSGEDFSKGKLFGRGNLKMSMMSWSKEALPKSLMKLGAGGSSGLPSQADELNSDALALYKTVQGFMGDRVYSFPDSLGCEVLGKALLTPPLRDEVFLQLAKQLSHNTSVESVRKGWQLMAMAVETFPPSRDLKPFLYNFLLSYHDVEAYHCRAYVSFCLRTLQQDLPAKTAPPSIDHVSAFRERVMTSAEVRIYFSDGSAVPMSLDATMTCGLCVKEVAEMIGLSKQAGLYGIYHTSKSQEPQFITSSECLLDYPASKVDAAAASSGESGYRFLFQRRIWSQSFSDFFPNSAEALNAAGVPSEQWMLSDLKQEDQFAASVMYHQLLADIFLYEHYDVSRDELLRIVAAHQRIGAEKVFQRCIGDQESSLVQTVANMQPTSLAAMGSDAAAAFRGEALALAATLTTPASYSPLSLLRLFSSRPHLGFQAFSVTNAEIKVLPATLWIGVSLNGLFLIDPQTKLTLKAFKFAHLAGWAANAAKFSVRVLIGRGKTQQLNFQCKHGKRIAATLQEFVDFIVKKQTSGAAAAASPAADNAPPLPPPVPNV